MCPPLGSLGSPAKRICVTLVQSLASGGDHGGNADRQPADPIADVLRGVRELSLDRAPSLAEVPPALVVNRERGPRPKQGTQLDGVPRGHRVANRTGDR